MGRGLFAKEHPSLPCSQPTTQAGTPRRAVVILSQSHLAVRLPFVAVNATACPMVEGQSDHDLQSLSSRLDKKGWLTEGNQVSDLP